MEDKYPVSAINRYMDRIDAINFFMQFVFCNAKRVAIENSIGIMSGVYRAPDQVIQPYEFGDPARKATCLWLKNLPKLMPTKIVEPELKSYICASGKVVTFGTNMLVSWDKEKRQKERSKTFRGIAEAMAAQWGDGVFPDEAEHDEQIEMKI